MPRFQRLKDIKTQEHPPLHSINFSMLTVTRQSPPLQISHKDKKMPSSHMTKRASKMAHWVKTTATKADNLSSIPRKGPPRSGL